MIEQLNMLVLAIAAAGVGWSSRALLEERRRRRQRPRPFVYHELNLRRLGTGEGLEVTLPDDRRYLCYVNGPYQLRIPAPLDYTDPRPGDYVELVVQDAGPAPVYFDRAGAL